jgi:anti-sigma factor RsiW
MSSDLRTMLARLADEPPPVNIDLDRRIAEGRRRVRRRHLLGGLACVVVLGLFGGVVASQAFQTAAGPPSTG